MSDLVSLLKNALVGLSLIAAAGCTVETAQMPQTPAPQQTVKRATPAPKLSERQAAKQFVSVVNTVEPVAERECRKRAPSMNCDFRIVVDDRPNQPVNAYQTVDKTGRPVIAFTIPLIASVRNADELAFVMSHEAAHHIKGHLQATNRNAATGALVLAGLATLAGAQGNTVQTAYEIGAQVGARSYSKDFELEADALGTVISKRAGYNPVRGAEFFTRIPDPGDRFLGTHPPNAQRIETVRRTASQL